MLHIILLNIQRHLLHELVELGLHFFQHIDHALLVLHFFVEVIFNDHGIVARGHIIVLDSFDEISHLLLGLRDDVALCVGLLYPLLHLLLLNTHFLPHLLQLIGLLDHGNVHAGQLAIQLNSQFVVICALRLTLLDQELNLLEPPSNLLYLRLLRPQRPLQLLRLLLHRKQQLIDYLADLGLEIEPFLVLGAAGELLERFEVRLDVLCDEGARELFRR